VVGVSLVIIAVVIAVTIRLDRDLRRRDPTSNGIGLDNVGRVGANHCGEVDHQPAIAMPEWALSAQARSSSGIKPASGTAADTPHGHAGCAMRLSTVRL
jgi:hypothetical protein